ncbi:hypothetical protein KR767_18790 [Luteibacter anthropi]|uniref:hypothetical protein n=1 Tax=Luteibacter anthropi TaxID=564369 RepID=UPI00203269B4|nr:hypothetical protein [Luteibacter anthropi]URX62069.1 hypothetical protein KR767_18790 [Luteibacter anthropi]
MNEQFWALMTTSAGSIAAIIALLFLVPEKFTGVRHANFAMISSKREKLNALLCEERLNVVRAVELELAFWDAFGFEMDARLIRFVFDRRNALQHTRYLRKCQLMVRISDDGLSLVPSKPSRRSFRFQAVVTFLLGFAPLLMIAGLASILKKFIPIELLVIISCCAFIWLPVAMWISDGFESAHLLTVQGQKHYPLDENFTAIT